MVMTCAMQVVTDEMWEGRAERFPEHTPNTREYYLLRSIFEEQFPSKQAMATVPKVQHPSYSCDFCCDCCRQVNGQSELPPCFHALQSVHTSFVIALFSKHSDGGWCWSFQLHCSFPLLPM